MTDNNDSPTRDPELMTAAEIARMCHTATSTVRQKWSYQPDFPAPVRPGRQRMWRKADIVRWIDSKKKG